MRTREKPIGTKNIIGKKVTELRQMQGLSQKQLMSQMQTLGADINYTSLSKIEGQTRIVSDKEVLVLAQIFNITADELLKQSK